MAFHDLPRFTKDIDILILSKETEKIKSIMHQLAYFESSKPWTFQSTKITLHRFVKTEDDNFMIVDILVGQDQIHQAVIDRAIADKSENGKVMIATKNDLIWLKQFRNSKQDQADIERLEND